MGKISAKYHKASGSRTSFFVVNRRKGFKTFMSKEYAELARCYQTILCAAGYAPKVHSEVGRITIGIHAKTNKPILSQWGYVVQRIKTLGCSDSAGGCDCDKSDPDNPGKSKDKDNSQPKDDNGHGNDPGKHDPSNPGKKYLK